MNSAAPALSPSRSNSVFKAWFDLFVYLVLAFGLLAITVWVSGAEVGEAFNAFKRGVFGSSAAWGETLARTAAFTFPGLAVALAFRAGLLNIGADGQFLCGAAGAAFCATKVLPAGVPAPLAALATLLMGALFGAGWALFPALLKKYRGVSEVISTILLNEFAKIGLRMLVKEPSLLQAHGTIMPKGEAFPDGAQFHGWAGTQFHAGIFWVIPFALILHAWIFHTRSGMALRAAGFNPRAALACGVPVNRLMLTTFLLSGALAGWGGAMSVMALGYLPAESPYPDCGYLAIAVALCAGLKPIWILPSAYSFAALQTGTKAMERVAHVASEAVFLVEGVVIIALLARGAHVPGQPAEKKNAE